MNINVQPLLPKLKLPSWEPNCKHWHSRCKRYHYVTRTVPLEWQTQHFIQTASCEV